MEQMLKRITHAAVSGGTADTETCADQEARGLPVGWSLEKARTKEGLFENSLLI